VIKAFSSEVATRSREENATNQKPGVFHRFRKTAKDSGAPIRRVHFFAGFG
jgi:hypothetical protein